MTAPSNPSDSGPPADVGSSEPTLRFEPRTGADSGPPEDVGSSEPTLRFEPRTGAAGGSDELTLRLPPGPVVPGPGPAPRAAHTTDETLRYGVSETVAADPGVAAAGQLGRHTVERRLGSGGMGEVVLAHDPALRRSVAAKLLRDVLDDRGREKFVAEAQVTGQLVHPNIVPVYELGQTPEGQPYFTMMPVRGRDLQQVLEVEGGAGPEALHRVLQVFAKVCDAMSFAHSKGVIHRDLKPANVMVGEFGEVLVMDWGLARVSGQPDARGAELALQVDPASEPTQAGAVMGTPGYMSPEQARGELEAIDARSDIYALGALLYALLTGVPPYDGESAWHVIAQVGRGELVPPSERTDRPVPWELEAVVLRAMALEPDARYPDVLALKADVEAFVAGRMLHAARYTPWQRVVKLVRRHRALTLGGLAVALTLAAVLGWGRWQRLRALDADVDAARVALAPHREAATALLAAWRAREEARRPGDAARPEPEGEAARRQAAIAAYLEAISRLDRVLARRPGHAAAGRLRRRAGRALGQLALAGADYTLALWSYRALSGHGEPRVEVDRLVADAEQARRRQQAEQGARVEAIVADVESGLSRPGRDAGQPTLAEYARELSAYRGPLTAARLARALAPLSSRASAEGRAARWSQRDRDVAELACRVLAQAGLPESVPPLVAWADAVRDPALTVIVGLALCDTRRPQAYHPLLRMRDRVGPNSLTWKQVRRRLSRVPEPADEGGARTAQELVRRAQARQSREDERGALADLARAIALEPDRVEAHLARGLVRLKVGDFKGAITDLERVLALSPDHANAYHHRGLAHLKLGNREAALADYSRAVAGGVQVAYEARGELLTALGRFAEARADLDRAIRRRPTATAFGLRADLRQRQHDLEGARDDLDQALRLDSRPSHRAARAIVRQRLGDLRGALVDFDHAIRLRPDHARSFSNRGLVRYQLGDVSGADEDFEQALRLDPEDLQARLQRASRRRARGDLTGALADCDAAIRTAPRSPKPLVLRARLHLRRKDRAAALADVERAIAVAPRDPMGYIARARLRRDPSAARADLDRAIALAPRDPEAHFVRARLRQTQGDLAGARADLDRLLEIEPGKPDGWLERGSLRIKQKDLVGGLADLAVAVERAPRSWRAWLAYGAGLAIAKRYTEAITALERGRASAPASIRARIDRQLGPLRKRASRKRGS